MEKRGKRKAAKRLFGFLGVVAVGFVGVTLYGARLAAKQSEAEKGR